MKRSVHLACAFVVYILLQAAQARVVDQCRSTEYVYDHSIDMVTDWRQSSDYHDVARFKRDMQGGTNTNPGANQFWVVYKSVKGFSKIFVRIVYYSDANYAPEEDRSFYISPDNYAKTPLTFTETPNKQLGGAYFSRDYTFTNIPANSHFFEIRFKPWTNIKGINYWTPQIAHVEFDEVCDPVSTCGNGHCEESCVSCPQDCGTCPTPVCGNHVCDFLESWSSEGCDADCGSIQTCGNWICEGTEVCGASTKYSCSADCCNGTLGFRPGSCGDGKCNGGETCATCARDCGDCAVCGDGRCTGAETCSSCAGDCGACNTCGGTSTTSGSTTSGSTTTSGTTGTSTTTGNNNGISYINLTPTDDSFIRSGVYSGNNYGTQNALEVKDSNPRTDWSREAFLKYDIHSVPGTIVSAQLIVTALSDSLPLAIDVSVMPDNWQESTVVWNNQPTVGALCGYIGTNGIGDLDLQALASVWSDKIISFQLWDSKHVDQLMRISSKEGANPAILRIGYTGSTTGSGTTSTTSGSTTSGSTTTSGTTGTPTTTGTTGTNGGTYDFTPVADANVRGGVYAAENYGTAASLAVKAAPGNDLQWVRDSYLKFNLNTLPGTIQTVQLIVKPVDGSSAPLNFNVAVVTDDSWNENTINWNNKPSSTADAGTIGNSGIATLSTSAINNVAGDQVVSLRLYDSQNQDLLMNVYSKEAGANLAPILRITV